MESNNGKLFTFNVIMNILYISCLSNIYSQGPNWSVPAGIQAQEEYDNVFWVNISDALMDHWKTVKSFHSIKEFEKLNLECFPSPFNKPDLVAFEGFYNIYYYRFAKELYKKSIPYIIIPRGEMTKQAQHNSKWLKKMIANLLLFHQFAKKAACVHFLTEKEKMDSGRSWNLNTTVLPNGFKLPVDTREWKKERKGIRAIYIGRMDFYHKGLDLLVEACDQIQGELRDARFTLDIYGPERFGNRVRLKKLIENKNLSDILRVQEGITGEEKKKVLLSADLFVMPSRFEGHPMGLIEALAYGVPCLVTEGTNMKDEIIQANAGWGVETSVSGVIGGFKCMLDEITSFPQKSTNARNLAKRYNWKEIAENTSRVYATYINNK